MVVAYKLCMRISGKHTQARFDGERTRCMVMPTAHSFGVFSIKEELLQDDVMGISKEIRHTKQRLCGIALPSVAA